MPARSLLRFPIVIVSLLVAFAPAHAESAAERSTLTGDWNGLRTRLENRGVTVTIASAHEWMRNLRGGAAVGSASLDNEDLQVEVDAERLVGWPGATWFVYGLRDHGHSPSEYAGDAQVVSNIDAPDAMKVFEAWLDQGFGERVSVRAGLYNVNSEFDSKDAAKPFLNSSHGIGKDWSQAGANGPSIFPTTSLAARLRVQGPGTTSALVLVADGVPGDPEDPTGTHIHLSREDGALLATEFGWSRAGGTGGHAARLGVGAWRFTGTFDHVERTDGAGDPERVTATRGRTRSWRARCSRAARDRSRATRAPASPTAASTRSGRSTVVGWWATAGCRAVPTIASPPASRSRCRVGTRRVRCAPKAWRRSRNWRSSSRGSRA